MDHSPSPRRERIGPALFFIGLVVFLIGAAATGVGLVLGAKSVVNVASQQFVVVQRGECVSFTPIETRSHTIWIREGESHAADANAIAAAIRITDSQTGAAIPVVRTLASSSMTLNNVVRRGNNKAEFVAGQEVEICLAPAAPVSLVELAPESLDERALLGMLAPCFGAGAAVIGLILTAVGLVLWIVRKA